MSEMAVSASDFRVRSAELLENVDRGRVLIRKHGEDRAYLIGVRELRALDETVAILADDSLMEGIRKGLEDLRTGNVQDAIDAFAEIDAELGDED